MVTMTMATDQRKKQLVTAYNADAKRRDEGEEFRDEWKLNIRQQFVNFLKAEGKEKVLEIGAGAGIDSKYFMDQGFNVLAVDLSEEMVKMCEKRGLRAKVQDLYTLPEMEEKFDGVYSMNVLLHVPKEDLKTVLRGIYEVLNPGGIFFYGVYGGFDEEKTVVDKTKMGLPRFFSFLSEETLLGFVGEYFQVIEFNKVDIGAKTPGLHFQAVWLRKRG